jgi:lipopolysaccharide/colanic/teichoic acid biosynthesis glycosyltransferase
MAGPFVARINDGATREPSDWWRRHKGKRAADLILALLLLVALAPLMAFIAVAIRLDGPGPVVYRQRRIGFADRPFSVLKFRTMRTDGDLTLMVGQSRWSDPRVTRVGRVLRRTSLDELPQMFNILRGDMTFVGPRPQLDADAAFFKTAGTGIGDYTMQAWWLGRRSLPPGLITPTKLAGHRGSENSANRLQNLIEIEIDYVRKRSFLGDVVALLQAVRMVIRAENAD